MDRLSTLWSHLSQHGKEFQQIDKKAGNLKGKTILVSGASRGIGKAIAVRCAKDGANIILLAKTAKPHPKLPGTIFTAADEVRAAGGQCLAIPCDIRSEQSVKDAIEIGASHFGGLDIVVNNASSLNLVTSEQASMKR